MDGARIHVVFPILGGTDLDGGGGTERRFARLFHYMHQHDYPVDVTVVSGQGFIDGLQKMGYGEGLHHVEISESERVALSGGYKLFGAGVQLADNLKPFVTPNTVWHASFAPLYQVVTAKRLGIPLVYSFKNWVLASGDVHWRQRLYTNFFMWSANHVDSLYPYVPDNYPLWRKKISVNFAVPIEVERFERGPKKQEILFVGRLIDEKSPRMVIAAVVRIQDRLRAGGWRVVMRGKGPLGDHVIEDIKRGGVADLIDLGYSLDLVDDYARARIYLKVNTKENVPSQSLLEAMASGCGIVATDVGNTRGWLSEGNAVLIPWGQEHLTSALSTLIEDSEKQQQLGEQALDWVTSTCDYRVYAQYYLDIWRRALAPVQSALDTR